jgi:hypothetical protein
MLGTFNAALGATLGMTTTLLHIRGDARVRQTNKRAF